MRSIAPSRVTVWLLIGLLLGSCAASQVRVRGGVADSGMPKPQRVLIYNFAVNPEEVQENSGLFAKIGRSLSDADQAADQVRIGREVADALATELTEKIAALGLQPLRADANMPVTNDSVLVTGRFVKIDEGNRLRRNAIGLGLGQSSIDSEVRVMAPTRSGLRELVVFEAHADSGALPGAAILGPAGAAAGAGTAAVVAVNVATGAAKTYRSASAQLARQMADKIVSELAQYFARQGWISQDRAQ
ncbi:MAG TPA: DUF4410 domain-containing protein [Methylococcus sp.]|nr:DUF4410 domain-containing protein [Methylococcus sp.]